MKYDYWGELIELCKEENRLVKKELIVDELTRWGLVLMIVLLLVIIFVR